MGGSHFRALETLRNAVSHKSGGRFDLRWLPRYTETMNTATPHQLETASPVRSRTRLPDSAMACGAVRCAQMAALGFAMFILSYAGILIYRPDLSADSLWLLLTGFVMFVTLLCCAGGALLGTLALLAPRQSRFAVTASIIFSTGCGALLMELMFYKLLLPR